MSSQPLVAGNWLFYALGVAFILLGISFFLIPLLFSAGSISNFKVPTILVYVYNKGGFYFVTSPILLIISAILVVLFFIRR
jgi:hypothetical protein